MFENFEVKPLFEDQIHERHHFTINMGGNDYSGVYHDEEIHWFHPQPMNNYEDEHIQAVEDKVHDLMQEHLQ
ncbi:hypothetical protein F7731_20820 [Cytobacillus depressus]|uniref:Uncharacterized protein n=1 Tax=Cytobacillus depressus TaxID=1602942 RepID=A0A6L3V027_9BACI|nr:DUF5342 family protein [Cytobacillus depressus]KAB2330224.1 hypothetical protein F7731_20820 [Cytobacillus depressus]